MRKDDPNDSTYTDGVDYRITVPRLAVGSHKFHFTAHSRVTPPVWWTDPITPYSVEVRFPEAGDTTGPTVVSSPPNGNHAPTLSGANLLAGPYVKEADEVDLSTIQLNTGSGGNWSAPELTNLRWIEGVYLNATLDANAAFDTNSYLPLTSPVTTLSPTNTFSLPAPMPAIDAGADYVQFGVCAADSTIGGTSLLAVTPDAPDRIGTVVGVYLTADLAGTNYYSSFDGLKIMMSQLLPAARARLHPLYPQSRRDDQVRIPEVLSGHAIRLPVGRSHDVSYQLR